MRHRPRLRHHRALLFDSDDAIDFHPGAGAAASARPRASATAFRNASTLGRAAILQIKSHAADRGRARADRSVEDFARTGYLVHAHLDGVPRNVVAQCCRPLT